MKRLFLSALLAVTASATVSALAQAPLPANQRYCLEVRDHSGTHPLLCRFETMAQCMASRNSPTDSCMLNPAVTFQQRR
jgi:hypothetical protein